MAYLLSFLNKKQLILFKNEIGTEKQKIQGKLIYFYFFTFILVCICGLRSVKIGLDTPQYYFLFNGASKFSNLFDFISAEKLDPLHPEWGYVVYEWVISLVGNYYFFLFITAVLTIVPVMWIIFKYSQIPWLSIVLFILFGYFSFYMTGLRQALALSFCMFAFHYSHENKLLKYLICIVLAFLFHQTAIIFLPIYWVKRIPLNKYVIIGTITLIGVSFSIRAIFYDLFMLMSRIDYTEHEDAGGVRMYIAMLIFVLLGFIWMNKLSKNELNKSLLYMMIICVILWPILSTGSPAVYRLYYYYHIFIILFSANLAMSIKSIVQRNTVILIFLFIGTSFFVTQIMMKPLNVYPYKFSWELPVDFNTLQHSWE